METNIKVHNDGKGKHQSYEVSVSLNESANYNSNSEVQMIAYGENKHEGVDNFLAEITVLIEKLKLVKNEALAIQHEEWSR